MKKTELLESLYEREAERMADTPDRNGCYLKPVFGVGNVDAVCMFIGEAPGATEAEEGKPFVGKAGAQLDRMLEISGIERDKLYITNSVKFRPWILIETRKGIRAKNRTPLDSEIKTASTALAEEISIIKPKIIVTLGNCPLKAIEYIIRRKLGKAGALHGKPLVLPEIPCTLFPLYHPASGIYNHRLIPVMEEDLKELGRNYLITKPE